MNSFSKILKNQRGVALMMIMTSIIILMAVYSEFTFDSKISRIKATNILDRAQAKLMAESGLQLAMTRLRLYKEAFNLIQKNKTAKSSIKPQLLNQIWEVPFMFPIPVGKGANRDFKDMVEKFQLESFLQGEMKVSIQNISNRFNLNLLRLSMLRKGITDPQDPDFQDPAAVFDTGASANRDDISIEESFYVLLERLVREKSERDEVFADKYGSTMDYPNLIANLKYYISDEGPMSAHPLAGEARSSFDKVSLTAKFGPMGSSSELYAIPGWDDEIIELIQNEFSVYPAAQIDLNKLTANMLRIILPDMTDENIQDFFEYRDDPDEPKFFNSVDDLKNYIVDQARIMTETAFKSRIELFNKEGITFGANPNLFKVISEGTLNRSTYTLVAYVVIPVKEVVNLPLNPNAPKKEDAETEVDEEGNPIPKTETRTEKTEEATQLLEPRVIEIQIN